MKHTAQAMFLDAVAEPGEHVEVEIQPSVRAGHSTLYVHVNGVTVVRIGHIEDKNIITSYARTAEGE